MSLRVKVTKIIFILFFINVFVGRAWHPWATGFTWTTGTLNTRTKSKRFKKVFGYLHYKKKNI